MIPEKSEPTLTGRKFFVRQPPHPKQAVTGARLEIEHGIPLVPDGSRVFNASMLETLQPERGLIWINIDGSAEHDALIKEVGERFGFHELALIDVVNARQRAKFDRFGDGCAVPHLFVVARIPDPSDPGETEQLSIFIRENLVVTIQSRPGGDCLDSARESAREHATRGRLSAGLLAAEILDAAVMDYAHHLTAPEEQVELLEREIPNDMTNVLIQAFHDFRMEALHLLRDLRPLEEVLSDLIAEDTGLITPPSKAKFKDALDHQRRTLDRLSHLAEESKELMNLTLAMASHKMNEAMQVLTVISALLIPPTFIAGVYGMNFDHDAGWWNMPELHFRFGYAGAVTFMAGIFALQVWLLVRNGWWVNPLGFKKRPTLSKLLVQLKTATHRSP